LNWSVSVTHFVFACTIAKQTLRIYILFVELMDPQVPTLITNDVEAAKALEAANHLTRALLEYRLSGDGDKNRYKTYIDTFFFKTLQLEVVDSNKFHIAVIFSENGKTKMFAFFRHP